MSAAEVFEIEVAGKGAHGAQPHVSRDPVIAAAQIVSALQTIVSRNVDPLDAAVLSVTQIHGGDAFNVIPMSVRIGGTIRTYRTATREMILQRLHEIVEGTASALGCTAAISLRGVTPVVSNHPEIAGRVQEVVRRVLPGEKLDIEERTMGSEDMGFMMDDVPGCYFFVGSANGEQGLDAPHHHPDFDIDERTLPRAAGLMASAAAEFLK
jgi:amidohydrolase